MINYDEKYLSTAISQKIKKKDPWYHTSLICVQFLLMGQKRWNVGWTFSLIIKKEWICLFLAEKKALLVCNVRKTWCCKLGMTNTSNLKRNLKVYYSTLLLKLKIIIFYWAIRGGATLKKTLQGKCSVLHVFSIKALGCWLSLSQPSKAIKSLEKSQLEKVGRRRQRKLTTAQVRQLSPTAAGQYSYTKMKLSLWPLQRPWLNVLHD